jgi:hypothetical protein
VTGAPPCSSMTTVPVMSWQISVYPAQCKVNSPGWQSQKPTRARPDL